MNTSPGANGLLSLGSDFERNNNEGLDRASTADLLVGDIDFTYSIWVKIETGGITQYIGGKGIGVGALNQFAWRIYVGGDDKVVWQVTDGTNVGSVTSNEALSVGVWALLIVWHDSVNNQVGIKISNNADKTANYTTGVLDSPSFFLKIACAPSNLGVAGSTFDGMMDEIGFWKKCLSVGEKATLYNGGLGRAYPYFSSPVVTTITSTDSMPSSSYPIPITITFGQSVTGFTIGDIVSVGLRLSNFTSVSPSVYTVWAAPTAASGTINIAYGVCNSLSDGQPNLAAAQFNVSSSLNLDYQNAILALNPISYLPLSETSGLTALDVTGNNKNGTYNETGKTLNQAGQHGASVLFSVASNYGIGFSSSLLAAINPREFSVSVWRKAQISSEEKVYEGWNAAGEYFAMEVRSLDNGIFLNEGGSEQVFSDLGNMVANEWSHLVLFNSESTGKVGLYLDGILYQVDRTLGGITPPLVTGVTGIASNVDGYYQHAAIFNHKLSQAEVNTICT
ncbi:MAG: LamG-like jellyroll fold domain-containing protein [Microgenomates group bacterium]